MSKIEINVPDGVSGDWKVETFTVSESESATTKIYAVFNRDSYVPAGVYKRLKYQNDVVMSNTPMEIKTNARFISQAKGSVLINGLGLGMVLSEILKKEEVTSVTVIENSKDVINLVAPTYEKDPRVTIIHADAFEYKPPKGVVYDVVWHDIWTFICSDNLPEMSKLHRKYAKRTKLWQGSWAKTECIRSSRAF